MKKYLIIKCGGSILNQLPDAFYKTICDLNEEGEWQPVLVHGGGPHISSLLEKMNVPVHFNKGQRVTSDDVLDVVEMVLCGSVNKQLVRKLEAVGGKSIGISGMDAGLLNAKPMDASGLLGFVGEVTEVDPTVIHQFSELGYIPVVAPLAKDHDGQRYNVNGDLAAAAIAKALNGHLCFVSNIDGVLHEKAGKKVVLQELTPEDVEQLIEQKVIYGGMIPKVQAAIDSLYAGAHEVVILNGLKEESLRAFTQGISIGTKFVKTLTTPQTDLTEMEVRP